MAEITVALISKLRGRTGAGMMDCKKALVESDGDLDGAIEYLRKKGAATADKKSGRATTEGVIARHLAADGGSGTLVEINCETDFVAKNEKFQAYCDETASALNENPEADLEERRTQAVTENGENIQIARHESLAVEGNGALAAYIHHGNKVGVLVSLGSAQEASAQSDGFKALLNDLTLQITATSPLAVCRDGLDEALIQKERDIAAEQFKDKPPQAIEGIVNGKIEKFFAEVCLLDQAFVKNDEVSVKDHIAAVGKDLGDDGLAVKSFLRFQVGETQED